MNIQDALRPYQEQVNLQAERIRILEQDAKRLVTETALRCAAIASDLEDDDCTAGAVWEAICREFQLERSADSSVPKHS